MRAQCLLCRKPGCNTKNKRTLAACQNTLPGLVGEWYGPLVLGSAFSNLATTIPNVTSVGVLPVIPSGPYTIAFAARVSAGKFLHEFMITTCFLGACIRLQFTGYLIIPATDVYTFSLESSDGSALLIDDSLIVNNDGVHAVKNVSSS